MKTINERLSYYLKTTDLKHGEIAEKLNISTSRLSNWLAKSSIPMYNITDLLEHFPTLDARWLLTGSGAMLNTKEYVAAAENNDANVEDGGNGYACKNPGCKVQIDALNEVIKAKDDLIEMYRDNAKKENLFANRTQIGEDTKRNKAG